MSNELTVNFRAGSATLQDCKDQVANPAFGCAFRKVAGLRQFSFDASLRSGSTFTLHFAQTFPSELALAEDVTFDAASGNPVSGFPSALKPFVHSFVFVEDTFQIVLLSDGGIKNDLAVSHTSAAVTVLVLESPGSSTEDCCQYTVEFDGICSGRNLQDPSQPEYVFPAAVDPSHTFGAAVYGVIMQCPCAYTHTPPRACTFIFI